MNSWIRFFFHALWRCAQECALGPFPFSKKTQGWGCCLTHGNSQAALCLSSTSPQVFMLLFVAPLAASRFFSLFSPLSKKEPCMVGTFHQPPHLSQPTPNLTAFPLRGFRVGTILCNWSLRAPSTHPTVGWTEPPLRRQLLGHAGQAGRTGRKGVGGAGLEALLLRTITTSSPPPLLSRAPLVGANSARQWKYTADQSFCESLTSSPYKATWLKKERKKKVLQLYTPSRGSTAAIFRVAFKDPLHFHEACCDFLVSSCRLNSYVFVFFLFFIPANRRGRAHACWEPCVHSQFLNDVNAWYSKLMIGSTKVEMMNNKKFCNNQKLFSVCWAAWYCYRLLRSLNWATKHFFLPFLRKKKIKFAVLSQRG